jgi:general secretion pathway protein C
MAARFSLPFLPLLLMKLSLPPLPWIYHIVSGCLLAAIAWCLAILFWLLAAPAVRLPAAAPVSAQPLSRPTGSDLSALNRWFTSTAAVASTAPSALAYKLRGVIAAQGDAPAAAIMQGANSIAVVVRKGKELEAGVVLSQVLRDHVLLDNHGRQERVELDARSAVTIDIVPSTLYIPPPSRATGMVGDEHQLNRRQLATGFQTLNIAEWTRGLVDAPNGGILVIRTASR